MISRTCTIRNATGIHTRPSRHFVDTATEKYPGCEVKVIKNGKTINGKSVLSMLTLGAKFNEQIMVEISGEGEEQAIIELGDIFEKIYQE
jgi:phosphocarrier protein HPr